MKLLEFFTTIWHSEEGYVRVATKDPTGADYTHKFFAWPKQQSEVIDYVVQQTAVGEVYYSPAVFSRPVGKKSSVKGSNVAWVEFDGNAPKELIGELPPPSIKVQSSKPGHEHWYWALENFSSPDEVEKINRQLAYYYKCDLSCWDIIQLLRPIETYNHKRQLKTFLIEHETEFIYQLSDLVMEGYELPAPLAELDFAAIPSIIKVVGNKSLSEEFIDALLSGFPESDRSNSLVRLAYGAAESGLSNEEIMSVLLHADSVWGKYHKREDHIRRLQEIVVRVRVKVPTVAYDGIQFYSLSAILEAQEQFDWAWEYYLSTTGYCLMTGSPGVGKTQLSLRAAMAMAQGKDFLNEIVTKPLRVGYLSLEMGIQEIQYFLKQMASDFEPEELEQINSNLLIAPLGANLEVGSAIMQKTLEELVRDNHLDGIFFDTLGSMTEESLSTSDKDVKVIMNWTDRLRNRTSTFVWINHHMRKAGGDNRKPNKLSDVYGSAYITARATSVFCLWEGPSENELDLITLKNRLSKKKPPLRIKRIPNLNFTSTTYAEEKSVGKKIEGLKWDF